MNDSLAKLLEYIDPKISNIQDNRIEFKSLTTVYQTLSEIVDLANDSCIDILDYYDQEFIIKTLKISNDDYFNNILNYNSSRYLLKNKDPNIKALPQYKESLKYIESLKKYLLDLYENIKKEYETLNNKLKEQEILNKYYNLLNKKNIFIDDISEFMNFLNICEIDLKNKLDILIYINNCNIKNYIVTNDIMITNDIKVSDITNLLNKYESLVDSSFNDYDLKMDTISLFKNNDQQGILKKKKYIINKIKILYDNKKYDEIINFYQEFIKILSYEEEFFNQRTIFSDSKNKNLIFVMNKDRSLVREFLDKCNIKYQSCIYKNLLDIENENRNVFLLPDFLYKNKYIYIKNEFVVKTIYTYLDNGCVLILGVLDKDEKLEDFLDENKTLFIKYFKNTDKISLNNKERNLILNNKKIEDLVLSIDLNTLDLKMEAENAR